MKIIIADDDHISLRLLSALLTKAGNEIVTCVDGSEALAKLETTKFDVAILDWMMPQISGIDVCRQLRQSGNNIYIILLTAKSNKTDLVEGLKAGADDYIVKPCDEQELRVRLSTGKRIINLQRQVTSLAQTLHSLVRDLSSTSANLVLSEEADRMLTSLLMTVSTEVTDGFDINDIAGTSDLQRQPWKYAALQAITVIDAFKSSSANEKPKCLMDTI